MPRFAPQIAYEAYAVSTGGKTYDGRDMPTWAQIVERTPHVARAWGHAALAVTDATGVGAKIRDSMTAEIKGGLDFSDALHALKQGRRVARAGWNGRGMWIALTPGSTIDASAARPGAAMHIAESFDPGQAITPQITILGHIDMRAADGNLVVGWLASQTDMLAEDWVCLDAEPASAGA